MTPKPAATQAPRIALLPAPRAGHSHLCRAPGERYCAPLGAPPAGPLRGEWHRVETWGGSARQWEEASTWPTLAARVLWTWLLSTTTRGRAPSPVASEDGALINRAIRAGAAVNRSALAQRLAGELGRPLPGVRKALSRASLAPGAEGATALPEAMREVLEGWAREAAPVAKRRKARRI